MSRQHNLTAQELALEMARLGERVRDLEDARELDAASQRNAGQALAPWEQVKGELERE